MLRIIRIALSAIVFSFALLSCDQLRQVAVDQAGDFHENSEGSADDPVPLELNVPHDGKVDAEIVGRRETANSYYSFKTVSEGTYYCCISNLSANHSIVDRHKLMMTVSKSRSFSYPVFSDMTDFGEALAFDANTEYFVHISNPDLPTNHSYQSTYSITVLSEDRSEGAAGSPIPIDPGTNRACIVGKKGGANASSYYSFTAPTDGIYTWSLDYDDYICTKTVYRDNGYTVKATNSNSPRIALMAGETVFLKVDNTSCSKVPIPFKNAVTRSGDQISDGTEHNPAQLILDTPFAGKIGAQSVSYYTFTTTAAGLYTCAVSKSSLSGYNFTLCPDSAYKRAIQEQSREGKSWSYNLSANTVYYILFASWDSSPVAYILKVSRTSDATNDGFSESPVTLQLGVPYAGKVGVRNGYSNGMGYSWYSFTTGAAGAYAIKASGFSGSLNYKLYSDPAFSSDITNATTSSGLPGIMLAASTTYYLKITNDSSSPDRRYSLLVSRLGDALNEGSVSSPVPLALGVSHDGRVGGYSDAGNKSYYSFVAPTTGSYDFAITKLDVSQDFYLYTDSGFTGSYSSTNGTSGLSNQRLAAGTSYYFLVYNNYNTKTACSYTITVNKK
jgi:hypothetical protein